MKKAMAWIAGAGLGAGLMYFYDPERGRRRRALVRDKSVHWVHKTQHGLEVVRSDTANRIKGWQARAGSWIRRGPVTDDVLGHRVRSAIGRAVSHPSSIAVDVSNGRVTLSGPILAAEVQGLLRRVYRVRGVHAVESHLEVHREAGHIPGLQGMPPNWRGAGPRFELMQSNWSPFARFASGLAGGTAGFFGFRRGGLGGTLMGTAGTALAARALTNMEFRRLLGVGAGRRAVDVQKTLTVNAPAERIFELLANPENYPNFMAHVRDVRKVAERDWRWHVIGPMGATFQWDSVFTSYEPNKKLAWRTQEGSTIQHAGIVRLQPNADGTTTVDIKLSYNPVGGAVGHAIASLLGSDPKSQLDDDLMRMKSYLETGVIPHDILRRRGMPAGEARAH